MNVTYTDRARQESEEYGRLQELSKRLEETIGPPADHLTAQWDRIVDKKGEPRYRLGITDWEDAAKTSFTLDELRSSTNLETRFTLLYDALLKARSHRLLRNVYAMDAAEN